jgi:hypothetical protein
MYLVLDWLLFTKPTLMHWYIIQYIIIKNIIFQQPIFNIAIHVTIHQVAFNAIQAIIYRHRISALVFF